MPIISYANQKQLLKFNNAEMYGGQTPVQQLEKGTIHAGKTKQQI